MKTFNRIMRDARNFAKHMHTGDEPQLFALTRGQVLHQAAGKLRMNQCWFRVAAQFNYELEIGQVTFQPLIQLETPCAPIVANSTFMGQIIARHCLFGGDTVVFHPHHQPDLQPGQPGLDYQILHAENAIVIPGVDQEIVEIDYGMLGVYNVDYFRLGAPSNSKVTQAGNYACYYGGLKHLRWRRLNHAILEDQCEVMHHDRTAQLIPTLWLGPAGPKLFLDFLADWRSMPEGDLVRARVRPFLLSHHVKEDRLISRTIIHGAESPF